MATVIVGIIIVAGLVGYTFYTNSSSLSSLSNQNVNLKQQLSGVSQQASTLGQQVSNLNQQESSLNQQISTLNQQVSILQQKTIQVVTIVDTVEIVETTTSTTTSTVTSVSAVPQSTLVIVGNTYDNASQTFQFTVQNTQNFTVYAQLSATFWGTSCSFYNSQGSYLSQVYTFKPLSKTVTTLNLNLGAYQSNQFCGHTPVVDLTMSYIAATSTSVSQTYTFNVIPYYTWP